MSLRPVQRSTLADRVAHELERMVVAGEWAEGSAIPPESALCKQLGVSRNTLREAVRALTLVGLLEARPGDGTYVRSNSILGATMARRVRACSLGDVLEARNGLERTAVRLAAERATPEEVEALVRRALSFDDAMTANLSEEELVQQAMDQERLLVRTTRNPILIELFESIAEQVSDAVRTCIRTLRPETEIARRVCGLHRKVVDAIAAGDPDGAAAAVVAKATFVRACLDRLAPEEP